MEGGRVGVQPRPERTSQRAGEHHPRMSHRTVCQRSRRLPDQITTAGAAATSRSNPRRDIRGHRTIETTPDAGASLGVTARERTADRT
jgi:hypothetical protein